MMKGGHEPTLIGVRAFDHASHAPQLGLCTVGPIIDIRDYVNFHVPNLKIK